MSDSNKIVTCSELNEMWRKCLHDGAIDNHPQLDTRWYAQAKSVFYSPNDGYDPQGGGLCVTFGGEQQITNSSYNTFQKALTSIWSHYLETGTDTTAIIKSNETAMFNPLYSADEVTNKLVKKSSLAFIPYEKYTLLNLINVYDNMDIADTSPHSSSYSGEVKINWAIAGFNSGFGSKPLGSSISDCYVCNVGMDEDISGRPVYLTISFPGTANKEKITAVSWSECFSQNAEYQDRDFTPSSIQSNASSLGQYDANVQVSFARKFNTLRELLTSQLRLRFYATWETVKTYERISINQNWYIKNSSGNNVDTNFNNVGGLCLSSSNTYYRKLWLFSSLYSEGYEITDFTFPTTSIISVNTQQLESAIGTSNVGSARTYYLKVPYYVKTSSTDTGTDVSNWCYIIIPVYYNPSNSVGSRWSVSSNSEAFIDVGTTDVSTLRGLYIKSDGRCDGVDFGDSGLGFFSGSGYLTHGPEHNILHKSYVVFDAAGNSNYRYCQVQFYSNSFTNTSSVFKDLFNPDEGGEVYYNFINSSSSLASAVKSFNNSSIADNYVSVGLSTN